MQVDGKVRRPGNQPRHPRSPTSAADDVRMGRRYPGLESSRGHPQGPKTAFQATREESAGRQHEMRETPQSGRILGFLPCHCLGGGPGGIRVSGWAVRTTHPWKVWRQIIVFVYY